VTFYAEQKVKRAVNFPLREAVEVLDKLIQSKQEKSELNNTHLRDLMKAALACHTAVEILEEDVNRLERDDDNAGAASPAPAGSVSDNDSSANAEANLINHADSRSRRYSDDNRYSESESRARNNMLRFRVDIENSNISPAITSENEAKVDHVEGYYEGREVVDLEAGEAKGILIASSNAHSSNLLPHLPPQQQQQQHQHQHQRPHLSTQRSQQNDDDDNNDSEYGSGDGCINIRCEDDFLRYMENASVRSRKSKISTASRGSATSHVLSSVTDDYDNNNEQDSMNGNCETVAERKVRVDALKKKIQEGRICAGDTAGDDCRLGHIQAMVPSLLAVVYAGAREKKHGKEESVSGGAISSSGTCVLGEIRRDRLRRHGSGYKSGAFLANKLPPVPEEDERVNEIVNYGDPAEGVEVTGEFRAESEEQQDDASCNLFVQRALAADPILSQRQERQEKQQQRRQQLQQQHQHYLELSHEKGGPFHEQKLETEHIVTLISASATVPSADADIASEDTAQPRQHSEIELQSVHSDSHQSVNLSVEDTVDASVSTVSKTALRTGGIKIPDGIAGYCSGNYVAAAEHFLRSLEQTEGSRLWNDDDVQIWPSDLRLWLCAALHKLGQHAEAQVVLNHTVVAYAGEDSLNSDDQVTQRQFIGLLMSFYAGESSVQDVLQFIGRQEEIDSADRSGFKFFGYFYLGLYYDSVGDYAMSQSLLSYPVESRRFSPNDVWYTIPLLLSLRSKHQL
jgi:hypothetical protein